MGIKSFFASAQISWRKRDYHPHTISFPEAIANAGNVLVCLPVGLRELTLVKPYLPELADIFSPSEMYLLASPGSQNIAGILPRRGYRILVPAAGQSTWSGLPSGAYLRGLHNSSIDLIVDLNLTMNPFVARALLDFEDVVKIGVSNILGGPFYNLEVRTSYLRDERNIYRSLIDTIANLRHPVTRDEHNQTRLSGM